MYCRPRRDFTPLVRQTSSGLGRSNRFSTGSATRRALNAGGRRPASPRLQLDGPAGPQMPSRTRTCRLLHSWIELPHDQFTQSESR